MGTKSNAAAEADALPTIKGLISPDRRKWVEIKHQGTSALLEYRAFAGDRGAIWTKLADRGIVLISRAAKAGVIEQIEALQVFEDRLIFDRPGWCEGQFVNASGRVFAPKGEKKGVVAFTPNPAKCSRRGSHSKWLEQVASRLIGHPIPCFFVMAAFAAPLLELVGRSDNFGFELAGTGGKGKSTTGKLMATPIGPAMEKDRGYITSFNMTPNALERSMQWHADMPFIIDEANLFGSGDGNGSNKNRMRDFAFQMSSGTTKGRFDSPQQDGYRFIYVTSANEPFNELLGTSHRDVANAAADRLMTITVPEGDAGVFGPLPEGYESYRQFTLALEDAMAANYGTAMPKFLMKLVKARHANEGRLKQSIWDHVAHFKREVGATDNNGSDARVAEAFALVYAAGKLAKHFRVLPADWNCIGAARHCYANYRSKVPSRQSLLERLQSIAARPETMEIDKQRLPTLTVEQMAEAGAFIRDVKGDRLLLMTTKFGRRMFPDWHALRRSAEFQALNKADEQGRGRTYRCRVRANHGMDCFYCFKLPSAGAEMT